MQTKKRALAISLILAALVFAGALISHLSPNSALGAEETVPLTTAAPGPLVVDNPYLIADIAELASPATVFISVEWPLPEQNEQRTAPQDPFSFFFDYWFTDPFQRQPRTAPTSAGSGFIIDQAGIILTNQHVVGSRGEEQVIKVAVDAPGLKREYEAEIIGSDVTLDLAVLQILNADGETFPTVPLGDSDASRIGEWLIAIGNPYGQDFEHTVTVGVLSAKGREITILDRETNTQKVYRNLMQTDAAINRGNSGGPLLNVKGEVIGINTAVHASAQGIGFAIPINVAKEVLDDLINIGSVQRTWLGISMQNLTENLAKQLRIPDDKGIVVVDVFGGSPADEAGIKPWDLIRRVGERDIFDVGELKEEITKLQPGDEVLLTVFRQGEVLLLPVILGNEPAGLR
ncbi:MAG TPA: trypsin-like serine protease [Firmicutes bacterium]|nr:trypsin-like serine protease [Bacillota bacterium]